MLKYLKLENVGPSPKMEIDFKPRMNFLTGDNGLGTTFLLDIAWWVLTRTWAKAPATPPRRGWKTPGGAARGTSSIGYGYEKATGGLLKSESIFNRAEQFWSAKPGRPAIDGIVIYAHVDGGLSAWDPARERDRLLDRRDRGSPSSPMAATDRQGITGCHEGFDRD